MKNKGVPKIFKKANALLKGHFKLSSGLHSEGYLQCALVLQYPKYAKKICQELANLFSARSGSALPARGGRGGRKEKPTVVIAPAIGGILVSYEVAKALGCRSIFTERENGVMTLRRGFDIKRSDRVLVVEDVVTTGGSTKEVIDLVRKNGAKLIGVGAIIDRSCEKIDFGVEFKSLVKLALKTFKPEDCPLCKRGIPVVKPGSRRTITGPKI